MIVYVCAFLIVMFAFVVVRLAFMFRVVRYVFCLRDADKQTKTTTNI